MTETTVPLSVQVVQWLQSLNDSTGKAMYPDARPVRVTIQDKTPETFEGALYSPGPEQKDRLYLLGSLPKSYERKAVYTHGGQEWYVAGYYQADRNSIEQRHVAHCHPLGRHFLLHVWDVPSGEKIDLYNRKPRQRIPLVMRILPLVESET